MTHPFLTAVVLGILWFLIFIIAAEMADDKNAIVRGIGYAILSIVTIAIALFVLTQYLGVKF